jgi:hypothetical protein
MADQEKRPAPLNWQPIMINLLLVAKPICI